MLLFILSRLQVDFVTSSTDSQAGLPEVILYQISIFCISLNPIELTVKRGPRWASCCQPVSGCLGTVLCVSQGQAHAPHCHYATLTKEWDTTKSQRCLEPLFVTHCSVKSSHPHTPPPPVTCSVWTVSCSFKQVSEMTKQRNRGWKMAFISDIFPVVAAS